MKKILAFSATVVALSVFAACNKNEAAINPKNAPVKVIATYEQPVLVDETKVSISESGNKFSLLWEGTENMSVANSSESNGVKDDFTTTDSGTTSATFTGATGLPAPKDGYSGETINYIGVVSSFTSATASNVRAAIRPEQIYDPSAPASIAKNAMLIARADNCAIGTLTSLSFKTMNAFMKFSLIKGAPADGASNTYDKMYVKNIVVEAVNEEYVAGRFGVSKTENDWYSGYAEEVTGNLSKTATLDCTNGATTKGVELGAAAKDFYVAIAFKTYARGLKITINVQNDSGDLGQVVGYYSKNTPLAVARNTMLSMEELTVRPVDADADIICWSENWNGGSANQTPEAYLSDDNHSGTVVYNNQAITYAQSTTSTKLYTGTMSAGGIEPELLLCKKANKDASPETWTISGIPTAGGTSLSLAYKTNSASRITVSSPTEGVTISGSSPSYTISTGGASTITLVFSNTTTSNVRIDDIVLKVAD